MSALPQIDPPSASTALIDIAGLQRWLDDGAELAFVDIREEGVFGAAHPLLAVNVPYSLLESELPSRVPRLSTRIVLLAEQDRHGVHAAHLLGTLGYSAVHVLGGGLPAWQQAGLASFQGTHVPSKAFAECVARNLQTPTIAPDALQRLIIDEADYVLLDSRTLDEYQRFHVPTAKGVPSAELLYRFDDLVPSPATLVVVTCAGRSRAIVGAQTLINAGVPNKVVALAGGTQGWRLAGLSTVNNDSSRYSGLSAGTRQQAIQRAHALAARHGLAFIDEQTLSRWQAASERTTYVFDVRSREEYAHSHRADARHVAGGQLVQTLDLWVGTRNARIVVNDEDGVRAITTAHWLQQLGWDVSVLIGIASNVVPRPLPLPDWSGLEHISAQTAALWLSEGAVGLSADRSSDYQQAHPRRAQWVNRSRLQGVAAQLQNVERVLVFAEDLELARGVALDLSQAGLAVYVVNAGVRDWQAAGIEVLDGLLEDGQRSDYLFWLHDRHTGNGDASAAYLAWEADLPRQVGDHGQARFRIQ